MKMRHEYTVTEDGRLRTAALVETEWNRDAGGWEAIDDLGQATQGRPEDSRHAVALRALARRLCVQCEMPSPRRGVFPLPPTHQQSIPEFDAAYERLAEEGACDIPGGLEHERVKSEWLAAGRPEIEPFIRLRANVVPGPDGKLPPV